MKQEETQRKRQIEKQRLTKLLEEKGRFSRELGIRLEDLGPEYAKGFIQVQKKHTNPMGMVHGGCLYSLADTVAGMAASIYGDVMVTTSGTLHYLEPAVHTDRITAVAQKLHRGKQTGVYDVKILNDREQVLATGTFSYFNTGDNGIKEVTDEA